MIAAIIGSYIGSHVSLMVPEKVMAYVLVVVLPLSAFLVLNKKLFNDKGSNEVTLDRRTYLTAAIAAFIIGCYDGFYGPGTGTFLIIAFTVFARLSIKTANAQAKVINLTTNITSLIIFLLNGQDVYKRQPQSAVALEGQIFLVVIHIENCLCRVNYPPCHRDSDLNGVAQTVIDLLPVIIQSHNL